jgi:hypothetical protein
MNSLQGITDFVELTAFDVRDNAFDLVLACSLACVVGILQKRLACRFRLRQPVQLGRTLTFELEQPGLKKLGENNTLVARKVGRRLH